LAAVADRVARAARRGGGAAPAAGGAPAGGATAGAEAAELRLRAGDRGNPSGALLRATPILPTDPAQWVRRERARRADQQAALMAEAREELERAMAELTAGRAERRAPGMMGPGGVAAARARQAARERPDSGASRAGTVDGEDGTP
jgi:hypothetical protein